MDGSLRGLRGVKRPFLSVSGSNPRSVFVLRNNDLGDVLLVTPLLAALRRQFPQARIAAGIGSWAAPILENNPNVDEVIAVTAPWHNKFTDSDQHSTGRTLRYLWSSPEVAELRRRRFDAGIDVLGSYWGAALLWRVAIPRRLGVRGYAGGHSLCTDFIDHRTDEHVAAAALRFAEVLGARDLPPPRAQLYLSEAERRLGEELWAPAGHRRRVVIGPGGGYEFKCWPADHYVELVRGLAGRPDLSVAVVGGRQDAPLGARLAATSPGVLDFTDRLPLRSAFALVAGSDLVICNSSMLLHVAAAFGKPSIVLLSDHYPSARAHQAQWGYEGFSEILGREPGSAGIALPGDVLAVVQRRAAGLTNERTFVRR